MKDGRAHAGGYVLSCDKGLKQQIGECEMHIYVFKRLLMLIPVILGVSFLVFFIMSLAPGDTARSILGETACLLYTSDAADEL